MTTPITHTANPAALVRRFTRNTAGRDLIVGDIHGTFSTLQAALDAVGFDPARDRLFSVGDLVDRGPESLDVLEWLDKPWFHPVQGNHDAMAADWVDGLIPDDGYVANGGAWLMALDRVTQREVAEALRVLPVAIELETEAGVVGIVHADVPTAGHRAMGTWGDMVSILTHADETDAKSFADMVQWSRGRFERKDARGVPDVRAVIVGHTPIGAPVVLGNVYHIDTMGWRGGLFTLLNAATLEVVV